jgi:hypothetical protein
MPPINHMLDRTLATVLRPSPTTTKGSTAYTYAAHLTNVKAHVHQMSTAEQPDIHGSERQLKTWRISVLPGTDIVENDQITYTDIDGTSRKMEVIEARDSAAKGWIRVLMCREMKTEAS